MVKSGNKHHRTSSSSQKRSRTTRSRTCSQTFSRRWPSSHSPRVCLKHQTFVFLLIKWDGLKAPEIGSAHQNSEPDREERKGKNKSEQKANSELTGDSALSQLSDRHYRAFPNLLTGDKWTGGRRASGEPSYRPHCDHTFCGAPLVNAQVL